MSALKPETEYLLEAAFGPEMPQELIPEWTEKFNYHEAKSLVMSDTDPSEVTPDVAKMFIRLCIAGGIGDLPVGWSFGPYTPEDDLGKVPVGRNWHLRAWVLKSSATATKLDDALN